MRRSPHHGSAHRRALDLRGVTTLVAFISVAALTAVACTTDSTSSEPAPETRDVGTATSPATDPPPVVEYSIAWEPVTDHIDGGWITVPLDYADPGGTTIDLRVARRRADPDERIGVLFSNNGGPGAGLDGRPVKLPMLPNVSAHTGPGSDRVC